MEPKSFYIRNMLLQYDRQLVNARRLARYRLASRLEESEVPAIPPNVKRNILIERVAREVYENLLFTGSTNPIVDDIRQELNLRMGGPVGFRYPPGELTMQIVRELPEGPEEVSPTEQRTILETLWAITLDKVNETML